MRCDRHPHRVIDLPLQGRFGGLLYAREARLEPLGVDVFLRELLLQVQVLLQDVQCSVGVCRLLVRLWARLDGMLGGCGVDCPAVKGNTTWTAHRLTTSPRTGCYGGPPSLTAFMM
eukprot:scaffold552_cov526-Prasinococcus_capsulatus_cf.AAC.29